MISSLKCRMMIASLIFVKIVCALDVSLEVISRKHPSVLHNPLYQSTSSENVVSNASSCSVEKNQQSCSVVPVLLSHRSAPSHAKLVYALLDSQSDSSFILDRTLDSFNVSMLICLSRQ